MECSVNTANSSSSILADQVVVGELLADQAGSHEPHLVDGIERETSVNPRFRFLYTGFFGTIYIVGHLSIRQVRLVGQRYGCSLSRGSRYQLRIYRIGGGFVMLYEAYEELRNKRLERVRQQGVQQGVQQERERVQRTGELIPPESQTSNKSEKESTQNT